MAHKAALLGVGEVEKDGKTPKATLGQKLSGLILSGPVFRPVFFLAMIFRLFLKLTPLMGTHGVRGSNEFFERLLVFNEYQKSFAPNKTKFDWFMRDSKCIEEHVQKFGVGHSLSWHYWAGFYDILTTISSEDSATGLGADLPVLVQCGSEDPLARKPIFPGPKWRVLETLGRELEAQSRTKILMYNGFRHEPHLDPEIAGEVRRDVGHFITTCGGRGLRQQPLRAKL